MNIYIAHGIEYSVSMPFQKGNKLGKKFQSKERHWNWNGGFKLQKSGSGKKTYKRIKVGSKYVAEHRYVMEQHLGRKLKINELVHHIDHDGLNNDISNLKVMTQHQHNKEHGVDRQKYPNGFTCRCGSNSFFAKDTCRKCYYHDYYLRKKYGKR